MPVSRPRLFLSKVLLRNLIFLLVSPLLVSAQSNVRPRITQRIDESILTTLTGNTYRLARPQFDQGAAPPSLQMEHMLLVLKRAPEQEAALQKLLDDQHDKFSTKYHQWLMPDEFGEQFGPSDQDIQTVLLWLQSHGFQVSHVAKGRTVIEFSGTAAQVREVFHAQIHKYSISGEEHWANATDPQIPTALTPVVAGVSSLHDFPKKPMHHVVGLFSKSNSNQHVELMTPQFTFPVQGGEEYALGPYDFAKIYNVSPLWSAGIDGAGQSIAIVGESNINIQDVKDFRNLFNLPKNDPQIILNGPDPGLVDGDETESDLDVEWSGAVARGATIKFVVSASTNSSSGVDLSALYIVDNDVAPILSESYGECELFLGTTNNLFYHNLWQQAAAEGITVIISSGDSGSAACDDYRGAEREPAQKGLMVNGLASTPYNVAVGGTDFMNFGPIWNVLAPGSSSYWNVTNDSNQASAKGYIPETAWNDSCANSAFDFAYESSAEANCNDTRLQFNYLVTVGGGGGASNCTMSDGQQSSSCSAGYLKPSWQVGSGVPNDNARDLPDISLFASNGFTGSFYIVCESDLDPNGASCNLSLNTLDFVGLGGTSSSAPTFAGIMAEVNQYTNSSGQGDANYVLYGLPRLTSQQGLNCNSASTPDTGCIINDVTSGTIATPCATNTLNCSTSKVGDAYGVLTGYDAGNGYDLATGLGSINAYNLVHNWSLVTFTPTQTTLHVNGDQPADIVHGQALPFVVSVTSGSGTPTGQISLFADTSSGKPAGVFSLNNGSVSASTSLLPGGSYTITARYLGDGEFGGSSSSPSVPVTVHPENSSTAVSVLTANQDGDPIPFSTGPYGSFVYLRADVSPAYPLTGIVESPPTGSVTFSDTYNGSSSNLAGSPYSLNSLGYTVTPTGVFNFPAGSHSISANYTGDGSYSPSNSSTAGNFTITPVKTTTGFFYSISPNNTVPIGTPVSVDATVYTTSYGNAPTGTLTFFSGTTQLGSPVSLNGGVDPQTHYALATATFALPAMQDGPNEITAQYSGDTNYLSSNGSGVLYELISTTTMVTTSSPTVAQGTGVIFTARVVANQSGGPPINGTVDFAQKSDSSQFGYYIAQNVPLINGVAQLTTNDVPADFLLTGNVTVTATYGNNNYYSGSSGAVIENVLVGGGADFTITSGVSGVMISSPGAFSNPVILTITGTGGFNSTVNFAPASCSISPAGSLSSCSFSPSSVAGSGSTQVTIQTTAPHAAMLIDDNHHGSYRPDRMGVTAAVLVFICFLGLLPRRRPWSPALTTLLFICLFALLGCGGAGGSGGGVGGGQIPGTPTGVTYTVTVTANVQSLSHSTSFTFVVQ